MAIRFSARAGLTSGQFRHGKLHVLTSRWDAVDANDPELRKVLLDFVGSHIRVHPDDIARLGEVDMALRNGRLVELERAPAKPKAPVKESRASGT